jgi:hypothetical protein
MVLDRRPHPFFEPVKEGQQGFPMEFMFTRHQSGIQNVPADDRTEGHIPPHVTTEFVKSSENV